MNDEGFKVSAKGVDVNTASLRDLTASSIYNNLKCDLRANPKNYGVINWTIATLLAGQTVTIHKHKHGYAYAPTFLTAWSYPTGTHPNNSNNSTFGIGNQTSNVLADGLAIKMWTDNTNFNITATNNSILSTTITNASGTIRYFVYADDFVTAYAG